MMLSSIRSSHAIGHHGRRDLFLSPPLRHHCVENGKRVLQFSSVSKSGERNGRIRCEIRRSVRDPILVVRAGLVEAAPAEEERKRSRNGRGVVVGKERFMVQRTEMVEGKVMVRMDKGKVVVGCDLEGKWVLHWGVTFSDELQFGSEWDQPPVKMRPPGSVPVKDYAVETPLKKSSSSSEGDMLHEVHIDLNLINNSIEAIHFVLREEETGVWYQNKGRNFKIPLVDGLYEDAIAIDVVEKFSIWPPGALNHSTNSDKKTGLVEGDCREYSILKEEHFVNSVTVSILRSEDTKRNHLLFDTDIPGEVVIHWGVCRDDSSTWQIPRIPHPPRSIVFRKKALQTLLQKKSEGVGSWGLFQLDNDVSGVPFVIKLGRHSYLDNVGNDFFVPLTGERSSKQKTINSEQDAIASEISREDAKEAEEIDSAAYTDEIINEIRNLMTDISAEKSMTTRSKESQENILEEIEKLAAEAYSIFRSSTPIFVEETVTDIESSKPSVHICSGTGSGYEILCQGFNWESNKSGRWYSELSEKANELSKLGITTIWLPPPTESVSPEGYMPSDLYNLNSRYGSVEELKNIVSRFHDVGINVLGDVVLNHRCAQYQNKYGIWNIFGGRLNWDDRAIVADDPHFQGRGNKSSGENFHAAPNIDHSQDFVRRDLKEWLCWLRKEVGYDGWRLDFARGFWGGYVKDYMEASQPYFAVGEFWDSLSYTYGQMDHNQDAHRQRIIDWINATNGTAGAFDVTTKGILHEALEKYEYWRLSDERGKPPGVMGWWPSRAVTFIENHDTGSTQGHWRFPAGKEMQGYAYILTHSGTPTVFYDHIYSHYHPEVSRLISLRHRTKIHCRSTVKIVKAERDVYAAEIDEKVAMKIGPGHYEPGSNRRWIVAAEGRDYKVWESQ